MSLTAAKTDPSLLRVFIHYHGFRIFSFDAKLQSNCAYTDLGYDHASGYSGPVWSPDGKYLLSYRTAQVADASTCAISAPFDSPPPDLAVWLK